MWCSTPCLRDVFENVGHVRAGRSPMSRSKSCAAEGHFTTWTLGTLSDTANASVVSKVSVGIDESAAAHFDEETVVTHDIST